jgi:imidazolonepropionase-like amidohydrolase
MAQMIKSLASRSAAQETTREASVTQVMLTNARLLVPGEPDYRDGTSVLVEGNRIKEVSDRPLRAVEASVIDCGGRVLMPGLIDCHVHVFLSEVAIRLLEAMPLTLMTARGCALMRAMLDRGFTTVRDLAGADWGIREALEEGLVAGPRLFICGRGIGQTSGHSDARRRTDLGSRHGTDNAMAFVFQIADGVDEVTRAAREQLRQGADFIKLMVSGGVASPNDPLESMQYTAAEISAAVEAAAAYDSYVAVHAYPAAAIARSAECGVRTIEHGNLIDEPTAALVKEKGAFVVPTLVAYDAIDRHGVEFGMRRDNLAKNKIVLEGGLRSLEIMRRHDIPMAFGSDLLGQLQPDQSKEFLIRSEVLSPGEIIRSATVVGAEVLRREGEVGIVAPGALADILVVDGDPLRDLGVFQHQGAHIPLIMKDGSLHKNQLA